MKVFVPTLLGILIAVAVVLSCRDEAADSTPAPHADLTEPPRLAVEPAAAEAESEPRGEWREWGYYDDRCEFIVVRREFVLPDRTVSMVVEVDAKKGTDWDDVEPWGTPQCMPPREIPGAGR